MDLWVVAVAAGAGYMAKNLQNLSADRKDNPITSSHNYQSEPRNFLQQIREKTCPLRRLAEIRVLDESFSEMESDSNVRVLESDELGFRNWESSDDGNLGWASSLPSVFSPEGSLEFEGFRHRIKRGSKFIRNRRRRFHRNRGFNSLRTCLDAQQCNNDDIPEDNNPYPYASTSPVRPVLVTDWNRMIDRQGYSVQNPKKESSHSQGHNTMVLFITGMIVGILSATTAWKTEVDKLNKLLEQMQNLVQDLQDELEMKENLMVKELSVEAHPSPGEPHKSFPILEPMASPPNIKLIDFDILKVNNKHAESLGLLSTIEAELQAELETLENNMNHVSTVDRLSGIVELDPDFEPDIIRGDLKPAIANPPSDSISESTNTTTGFSQPANYSVSPWELSLRLHELIESRLETRITELETALANTLNRAYVPHSFEPKFSRSETESSSVHWSPSCICDERDKKEDELSVDDSLNNFTNGILKHDVLCSDKQMSTSFMSNMDSESDNEENDESEMMLIKRIVERRRLGSNFKLELESG